LSWNSSASWIYLRTIATLRCPVCFMMETGQQDSILPHNYG
jgi:hypothetical protein